MNPIVKKSIECDDVSLFGSSLLDKDYFGITINQTLSVHGNEYHNPNLIQYLIIQDKPICLSYVIQSSPEFRGLHTPNKPGMYITDSHFNLLHLGIECYSYKSISVLLELVHSRPDIVNEPTTEGQTALHIACKNNMPTVVHKLIQYGSNPLMKDKNNLTPLHYATMYSDKSTEILCKYLHHNYPRSFFYIIHKPIYEYHDLIEFCSSKSEKKDTLKTLQFFEQIATEIPALDEPEPSILEMKCTQSSEEEEEDTQTTSHKIRINHPSNSQSAQNAQNVSNVSNAANGQNAKESSTCSVNGCIHYKRLRRCHICGKFFCPLHLSDHSHERSSFFPHYQY